MPLQEGVSDRVIRKYIVKGMGVSLRHEVAKLCSDDSAFVLQNKHPDMLKSFTWEGLLNEARELAPTLTDLLLSCTKTRKPRKKSESHRRGFNCCLMQASQAYFVSHSTDCVVDLVFWPCLKKSKS